MKKQQMQQQQMGSPDMDSDEAPPAANTKPGDKKGPAKKGK